MSNRWSVPFVGLFLTLTLILTLTACSGDADEPAAPAAPQATAVPQAAAPAPEPASGPPKADRLIIATAPFGQESNVRRVVGQISAVQFDILDEHLIGLDATNGEQIPELASEWSLEAGPSYRFKLQKGVQFHNDWGEMTADDVVFTAKEFMKEDAIGGVRTPLVKTLDRFEIVNDHEVIFHMKLYDADFLNIFARQQPIAGITSKAHFESLGGDPTMADGPLASTGPYKYSDRSENEFIRYERVGDHWNKDGDFNEIQFTYSAEASTRLAGLLTGEVHIANLPEDQIKLALSEGMELIEGTATMRRAFFRWLCCYVDPKARTYPMHPDSPLQDARVRRALNKSVDRQALNQYLFGGKGMPMYLNNYHPTLSAGWDPIWETKFEESYGYDPAAAKALLAEAGYSASNPLETNMHVYKDASLAGADDIAEATAAYFAEVGVKVKLISDSAGKRRAARRVQGYDNHLALYDTSAAQFTGLSVYATNTSMSVGATTPAADAKFLEVRAAVDAADQDRLLRELGNIVYDSYSDFPLFYLPAEVVVNPGYVDEWVWPGYLSGFWSHLWNTKGTR